MCRFIVATLPAEAALATIAPLFAARGRDCTPFVNRALARQLPPGERILRTTRGHCDCDSWLGRERDDDGEAKLSRELGKLRDQGWSETKQQRWLAEQRQRRRQKQRTDEQASTGELRRWLALVDETLALSPRLGLFVHMYEGTLDDEQLTITRQPVPRAQLTLERLRALTSDVVYEFSAR